MKMLFNIKRVAKASSTNGSGIAAEEGCVFEIKGENESENISFLDLHCICLLRGFIKCFVR